MSAPAGGAYTRSSRKNAPGPHPRRPCRGGEGEEGKRRKTPLAAAAAAAAEKALSRPSAGVQYDGQTGVWRPPGTVADAGRRSDGRRWAEQTEGREKRPGKPGPGRRYRRKTVAGVWAESGGGGGGERGGRRRGEEKKNHTTERAAAAWTGARRCCQWVTRRRRRTRVFVRESCLRGNPLGPPHRLPTPHRLIRRRSTYVLFFATSPRLVAKDHRSPPPIQRTGTLPVRDPRPFVFASVSLARGTRGRRNPTDIMGFLNWEFRNRTLGSARAILQIANFFFWKNPNRIRKNVLGKFTHKWSEWLVY